VTGGVSFFLGALATAGFAAFLRALPWPKAWLARKPLGCPVCMGLHTAGLVLLFCLVTGATDVTDVVLMCAPKCDWRTALLQLLEQANFAALVLRYFAFGAVAALALERLFPPPLTLPSDASPSGT